MGVPCWPGYWIISDWTSAGLIVTSFALYAARSALHHQRGMMSTHRRSRAAEPHLPLGVLPQSGQCSQANTSRLRQNCAGETLVPHGLGQLACTRDCAEAKWLAPRKSFTSSPPESVARYVRR